MFRNESDLHEQDMIIGPTRFEGDLSEPDPIPDDGIEAAVALMRDGRLFRYGENRGTLPVAAMLEEEVAALTGRRYCLGVNSCGCAMFLALKSLGIGAGDKVLVNAFTLAPVPGAIAHAGATAVLVDIDERLVIDLADLERKAKASGAKVLLLSYMRGHIPDMDALMALTDRLNITVVEDCAHTLGAAWGTKQAGSFGVIGCFSTQTFKHLNSGEGGLFVTDDEDLAAKAILLSGSYMLYRQHKVGPADHVFDRHRYEQPNFSMRMTNLAAALLRAQLPHLEERIRAWRRIYRNIATRIEQIPNLRMPERPQQEAFVPSSLQFLFTGLETDRRRAFLNHADTHGVHVKWFGARDAVGFTARHDHWRYLPKESAVPNADRILRDLCDIRLPAKLSDHDCTIVATVLSEAMEKAVA